MIGYFVGKICFDFRHYRGFIGDSDVFNYAERKVAAFMRDRIGPIAGPGILQPLADGLKLFAKEEIIPNSLTNIVS